MKIGIFRHRQRIYPNRRRLWVGTDAIPELQVSALRIDATYVVGGTPILVDVLPAIEAETANPITPLLNREIAVGTATEVELGQVIDPQISREVSVGTATEVEAATAFGVNRDVEVGVATEVELGQTITPAISREVAVGTATEVEIGPRDRRAPRVWGGCGRLADGRRAPLRLD
jgi:hypothetical protein